MGRTRAGWSVVAVSSLTLMALLSALAPSARAEPQGSDPSAEVLGADIVGGANARRGSGSSDQHEWPPVNPHLADSPWPIFHQNGYAQANTRHRGPEPGDALEVQHFKVPAEGQQLTSHATSPWLPLSEVYPDGCRAFFGSGFGTISKGLVCGDAFEFVDSLTFSEITGQQELASARDGGRWANLLLAGNEFIVPDPRNRAIYRIGDVDPTDSRSPIEVEQTFHVPEETPGNPGVPTVTHDGWLIYLTSENYAGAVRASDFSDLHTAKIPDGTRFNNHPIDEEGGMYIVTGRGMFKLRWTGDDFVVEWEVDYTTIGPAANGWRGSGTTPTLLGVGPGMDHLVVVIDAHQPSNAVAFWRDEIPDDWPGLPGHPRRVAAVTELPLINPAHSGWAVEVSPPAHGYSFAVNQYNGLAPGVLTPAPCVTTKGMHRLTWDPDTRALDIDWSNDQVNINSVMTYSAGSNLLYGIGNELCDNVFYAIDWDTGSVVMRHVLGGSDFADGGDNVVVNDDGSLLYSPISSNMVRIRPVPGRSGPPPPPSAGSPDHRPPADPAGRGEPPPPEP